ncbi:MAG: hypothetical protein WCX34_06390 [Syntrophales bacterium]
MRIRLQWLVMLFCLSGAMLTPAPGLSAAATAEPPGAAITLEEVVVTATKTPAKRRDVPNAVLVLDAGEIRASGAKTIGELLANEPGIDWQTTGITVAPPRRSTSAACGETARRS